MRTSRVLPLFTLLALLPFACTDSDPSPAAVDLDASLPDGKASDASGGADVATTEDAATQDSAQADVTTTDAADDASTDAASDADATPPFSTTFQLAQTDSAACAVFTDGRMKCWALPKTGESSAVGDGPSEMGANLPFLTLPKRVRAVRGGYSGTMCVIWEDGGLRCWNGNTPGQTGLGGLTLQQITTDVDLGTGRTAVDVSMGNGHACAALDDGTVKCWGFNSEGQLGQGDTTARTTPPVLAASMGTGVKAKSVHAGAYFTCAHLDNDRVKCWGRGNNTVGDTGQGGNLCIGNTAHMGNNANEMGDNLPFARLGTNPGNSQPWKVKKVGAGNVHVCALLENNRVKCWGRNDGYPYVGSENASSYGSTAALSDDNIPFVNVGTDPNTAQPWVVKDLAVGEYATCVIVANDTVRCWGSDIGVGLLGRGTSNSSIGDAIGEMGDQLPVVPLGTGKTASQLWVNSTWACARVGATTLNCWGSNANGKLGQGLTAGGATQNIGDVNGEMGAALVDTLLE